MAAGNIQIAGNDDHVFRAAAKRRQSRHQQVSAAPRLRFHHLSTRPGGRLLGCAGGNGAFRQAQHERHAAEFYPVSVRQTAQRVRHQALAVDPRAVRAAEILHRNGAVLRRFQPGMGAGNGLVERENVRAFAPDGVRAGLQQVSLTGGIFQPRLPRRVRQHSRVKRRFRGQARKRVPAVRAERIAGQRAPLHHGTLGLRPHRTASCRPLHRRQCCLRRRAERLAPRRTVILGPAQRGRQDFVGFLQLGEGRSIVQVRLRQPVVRLPDFFQAASDRHF